ncbi:hypothetical protein E2C01_035087 [Portunus trituberculatus]|uniref:Uncharacterized protein n=1 Tax=Portunus trituberculatus TaxID=210409 RepID=A0A5B7FAI3_PORTR|nr:hypothetical protein [Portunus trituberculatus]
MSPADKLEPAKRGSANKDEMSKCTTLSPWATNWGSGSSGVGAPFFMLWVTAQKGKICGISASSYFKSPVVWGTSCMTGGGVLPIFSPAKSFLEIRG